MDAVLATLLVVLGLGAIILAASRPVTHKPSKNLDRVIGWSLIVLAIVLSGIYIS